MIGCSACLCGMACKYNGKNNNSIDFACRLVNEGKAIPVCPEMLGGLPVPRIPSEILGDRVINRDGVDVTKQYHIGAKRALAILQGAGVHEVILKRKSPACGIGLIYDGTFTNHLVEGDGIFVKYLKEAGIKVYHLDESHKGDK